ncbi:MAG: hypothetical protein ABI693_13370 [Bryobacteraceae bacterium]
MPKVSILLLLLFTVPDVLVSQPPPEAQKMLGLFDRLRAADAARAAGHPQPVSFHLTGDEVNSYMRYSLRATPRPGLDSVTVKFFDHNYVSIYSILDFDAVERWKPGTIPSLLRPVLSGKKSIWTDFRIRAENSKATLSVEKAYCNDIRLPAFLVEKMIAIVAARQPEHYDTSKPLPLPFGLREIHTTPQTINGSN